MRRSKTDAADAAAICEAVGRPSMRFVPVKSEVQQAALLHHRVRDLLARQRTMLINALRAHLAEFGIIAPTGHHRVGDLVALIQEGAEAGVPKLAREALLALIAELQAIEERVAAVEAVIVREHKADEMSRRLAAIPGIGPTARRWLMLHQEISEHDRELDTLVAATAPELTAAPGIANATAADLLLLAGDNPERIHSEAAFAKLCGACPIPASSGRTNRHRLNRGGDRQANAALHRIVVTRMRIHQPTIEYVARRTREGKTKPDIMRCLKRYVAREAFALIKRPGPAASKPA